MKRYAFGTLAGFAAGFFMLHPLSMLFQGLVHPAFSLNIAVITEAFNMHHIPMAFFFGALTALVSAVNIFYLERLTCEKRKVRALESLLPICAYCKKIRDDSGGEAGVNGGKWYEVEKYFSMKTDAAFTHGVCPSCYRKVMDEIEEKDGAESIIMRN